MGAAFFFTANYGELRAYDRGLIKPPLVLIRKKKRAGEAKTMCVDSSPIRVKHPPRGIRYFATSALTVFIILGPARFFATFLNDSSLQDQRE